MTTVWHYALVIACRRNHKLWTGCAHTFFQQVDGCVPLSAQKCACLQLSSQSAAIWHGVTKLISEGEFSLLCASMAYIKLEGKEDQVSFSCSSVEFVKLRSVSRSMANIAKLHFELRKKKQALQREKLKCFGSSKQKKALVVTKIPKKLKQEARVKKKCKQCEPIWRSKPAQSWELGCDISNSKDL